MSNLTNTQKLIELLSQKPDRSELPTVNNSTITVAVNWNEWSNSFTTNQSQSSTLKVVVTKADVWLSNVDNTSDADKPVSTAVLTELNKKANTNDVYNKSEVDSIINTALSSTYRYRWSVVDYEHLPTENNHVWDVWNVESNWVNYAWDWQWWDALWTVIDMSLYLSKQEASSLYATKTELSTEVWNINSLLSNNYYTNTYIDNNFPSYTDLTNSINSVNNNLTTNYYTKTQVDNAISTVQSQVSNAPYSNEWDWDETHAPSKNAVYDVLWDIDTLLSNI